MKIDRLGVRVGVPMILVAPFLRMMIDNKIQQPDRLCQLVTCIGKQKAEEIERRKGPCDRPDDRVVQGNVLILHQFDDANSKSRERWKRPNFIELTNQPSTSIVERVTLVRDMFAT
ncbi:hypothetical protein [Burkholderia multivorans]|uniref:hypothetical protein n=1 Tax=Burkholderia multivorans TaxID=87883 RepID=UPI0021BE0AE5|nr:hypothetical protein [Burkholderia multivorans]